MVIVQSMDMNYLKKEQKVSLFADAKAEVTDNVDFEGKMRGFSIAQGSDVMTADGELAFMRSDGHWNWI